MKKTAKKKPGPLFSSGRGGRRINSGREPAEDPRKNISIRLPESLLEKIDQAAGTKTGIIEKAVVDYLSGRAARLKKANADYITLMEARGKEIEKLKKQVANLQSSPAPNKPDIIKLVNEILKDSRAGEMFVNVKRLRKWALLCGWDLAGFEEDLKRLMHLGALFPQGHAHPMQAGIDAGIWIGKRLIIAVSLKPGKDG